MSDLVDEVRSGAADPASGRPGIDRRTLIRRAAAAGAIAWSAPVIIGSLTSPAAALTGLVGCNGYCINGSCGPNNDSTPCVLVPGCSAVNPLVLNCIEVSNDSGSSWHQLAGNPDNLNCQAGNNDPNVWYRVSTSGDCTGCTLTASSAKSGSNCINRPPVGGIVKYTTGEGNFAQTCLTLDCN